MQMKQRACGTIARLQFAVLVKQRERFERAAEQIRARVKVQGKKAVVETFDEAVFDAFGGGPQQGIGMRQIGACISGNVENAGDTAGWGEDRRGNAGEEAVAGQIVLTAINGDGLTGYERGADCVRPHACLAPLSPGAQRDAGGTVKKAGVADRAQDHAVAVGQQQS